MTPLGVEHPEHVAPSPRLERPQIAMTPLGVEHKACQRGSVRVGAAGPQIAMTPLGVEHGVPSMSNWHLVKSRKSP